jgi:hypothetical protein
VGSKGLRGWLGLTACLDAIEKREMPCPCRESNYNSSAVQPVVLSLNRISCYCVCNYFYLLSDRTYPGEGFVSSFLPVVDMSCHPTSITCYRLLSLGTDPNKTGSRDGSVGAAFRLRTRWSRNQDSIPARVLSTQFRLVLGPSQPLVVKRTGREAEKH